jgi:hypothetical protein
MGLCWSAGPRSRLEHHTELDCPGARPLPSITVEIGMIASMCQQDGHIMHPVIKLISAAALLALGGCASQTASRMGAAATSPLTDLGIRKEDIPAVLAKAQENPYLMPAAQSCVAIALEIHELDDALGPDYDAPPVENNESFMEKASDVAEDQAVGAVQRTAEGLIPFRSWVRKLSGAEKHARQVSACVAAGTARRAFLKGLAASQQCALPQVAALKKS